VLLSLTARLGAGAGLSANQRNVASAINNVFNTGGTLPANFTPIFALSGSSLANALSQLDGEAASGGQRAAFQLTTQFLGLMLDPSVYGRSSSAGIASGFAPEQQQSLPPDIALAYGSVLKAPPKPAAFEQRWSAWGSGFGGGSTTNGDAAAGTTNVTARSYGFAGGMDYHFSPDTVAGFALAGAGTNWSLAQGLGGGRSDAFQAGLYATTRSGPAYLAGALAFANHWMTTSRTAFAGDQLHASFNGQSYAGRLEAGYRYTTLPAIGITPYAALQAQSLRTPSYSETDVTAGGFGLSYNAATTSATRSELGARFDALTMFGGMPLVLRARAAWAHDWISNPALTAAFQALPAASFIVNGATPPQDLVLASAGAELQIATNWSLMAKFDGEFAKGAQTYAGTGTLRYRW
jgi:outer membrane autotransporter protein